MPSDLSWFSSVHYLTLFSQCLGCALLSAPFCRQISALLRLRSYVGALMSALLCRRSIVGRSFDGVPLLPLLQFVRLCVPVLVCLSVRLTITVTMNSEGRFWGKPRRRPIHHLQGNDRLYYWKQGYRVPCRLLVCVS